MYVMIFFNDLESKSVGVRGSEKLSLDTLTQVMQMAVASDLERRVGHCFPLCGVKFD